MCIKNSMVKKPRILIITYNFPPDISAGAFRVDNIVRKLSNYENVTIDIITSTPNRYSTFKSSNKKNYFEHRCRTCTSTFVPLPIMYLVPWYVCTYYVY